MHSVHVLLDFGCVKPIGVFGAGAMVFHAFLCGSACFSNICCSAFCGGVALACYVVDSTRGLEALDGVLQVD
jgi:hypothetical protein